MPMNDDATPEALQAVADAWNASQVKYDALRVVAGGRVILDALWTGDRAQVDGVPVDQPSLRAIGRLLGRDPSRLSKAMRTTVLYDKLPEDLRDALSASHYEALLLADEIERERWAREAVRTGMGYRELVARITGKKPAPAERPDTSPMAAARRVVDPLREQANAVAGHPAAAKDFVGQLDALLAELHAVRQLALVPNPSRNTP